MEFDAKKDMNGSAADPLKQRRSDHGPEVFAEVVKIIEGCTYQTVVDVAAALILNALRQAYPTRREAEASLDAIVAKAKGLLDEHYDRASGKRKSIFAHTQILQAPCLDARAKPLRGQ